jgi:hypothetical protein
MVGSSKTIELWVVLSGDLRSATVACEQTSANLSVLDFGARQCSIDRFAEIDHCAG